MSFAVSECTLFCVVGELSLKGNPDGWFGLSGGVTESHIYVALGGKLDMEYIIFEQ